MSKKKSSTTTYPSKGPYIKPTKSRLTAGQIETIRRARRRINSPS